MADQGLFITKYPLGEMYRYGYGVSQDYDPAVAWTRKAADHGYFMARLYMGFVYLEGG